ncbi:MAG: NADP(H)-dependent aldo-keto reductase [Flavobacteriaceae bacterium]|nr:NADP(H)-dependent aldo-keto reductase [Flavobacteriaceae bacterium]
MIYSKIPGTETKVSKICLGTMTWGEQNTQDQAHQQMDFAVERGVNFFDVAELYPIPPNPKTQGDTERFIGNWFKQSGRRDKIILATKISGPAPFVAHIRDNLGFSNQAIDQALELSLKRLKTDYIDLYQLHWPERKTNFFGQRGYSFYEGPSWENNFHQVLQKLEGHIKAGKIRHIGVSNENPWGLMKFLEIAKQHDLPLIRTVQNPYSLVNRLFEVGNAEICHHEDLGLLAYSPLAFGTLSGKYLDGKRPPNSRLTLFSNYDRYNRGPCVEATRKYVELSREHGLKPAQMALSFVNSRPFVTSNIIGATTLEQLQENIESIDVELGQDILDHIDQIQESQPNPSP